MTRRHDIVCLSSIDWDFIWQSHQEVMSTFAAQGHRVLFVENTGVRRARLSDLPRARQRIRNWWRGTQGFRQDRENLFVYSPVVLPFPYSRLARLINRTLLRRAIGRWMRAARFTRPIVWTFLPTPLALDVIRGLDPKLTVYYCVDDFASSSPQARQITHSERQLFAEADIVFVTSERLRERAAEDARAVHVVPSGVSLGPFEEARDASRPPPPDIDRLRKPIVGYVGGLHQWVDQDLLARAAEQLPDASFALIGPVQTDLARFDRCPNVHLLGAKRHEDIPDYLKAFDVGLVPYKLSDYTEHVYPAKLNEYLSMGMPVVTTDLAEIRRFNRENGGVVSVADGADAFAAAIRVALDDGTAADRQKRIDAARRNSWAIRISRMWEIMEPALAAREAGDSWDVRLRKLYRRARRRSLEGAVAAVAVYLLLFQTSFVWWLASPLKLSDTPRPADAIVVFAGGVGESGQAGGGYQERVKRAADLYRSGLAPHVVFSSGYVYAFQEAEIMKALAVANGIPDTAIVLEKRAANTYQNVLYSRDIVERSGWRRVLLVSSPYHMRRAVLTWHHAAPDIEVTPTPPAFSQFYDHDRGASLDQIRGLAQEYAAIVLYWWRGWI
jgi:uncharacterized SAM-binding protein YcdF (DUF218 family)/glycosyltransferase involved in cell wall biosynthesis